MRNLYHDIEIVVNADHPDWGKRWGVVPKDTEGCWCYDCTIKFWASQQEWK